ncbi:hypothetical protein [Streptomyces sp. NPDC054837]
MVGTDNPDLIPSRGTSGCYQQVIAPYDGRGSTNDAANFRCTGHR